MGDLVVVGWAVDGGVVRAFNGDNQARNWSWIVNFLI
jgi:hypothetical protein